MIHSYMIAWGGELCFLFMDLPPGFILDNIAMVDEITHLASNDIPIWYWNVWFEISNIQMLDT